jgi:hypothetical protein
MSLLTPRRRMAYEVLDAPDVLPALVTRSHEDIVRANALFGGTAAVVARVRALAERLPAAPIVADIGAGSGDVLDAVCATLRDTGRRPQPIAVDIVPTLAPAVRLRGNHFVCASILALPFATASVDLVICAQTVHHFTSDMIPAVIMELNRIARCAVLISDLRRSWIAAAGLWVSSFPLGFHPASRHDGVVSVLRGFTGRELHDAVTSTTGVTPSVHAHLGWRLTADWTPQHATRLPSRP